MGVLLLWWSLHPGLGSTDEKNTPGTAVQTAATVQNLCARAYELRESAADSGLSLAYEALGHAKEIQNPEVLALAYRTVGILSDFADQDTSAISHFRKALNIYRQIGAALDEAVTNYEMSRAFRDLEDHQRVVELIQPNTRIIDSLGTRQLAGDVHNFLGLNLWMLGKFGEAEYHYLKALELYSEELEPIAYPYTYNNLGVLYFNWSRYEEALNYYQIARDLHAKIPENRGSLALVIGNIGATYLRLFQEDLARSTLTQALELAQEVDSERATINAINWMAKLEAHVGEYQKARSHLRQVIDVYRGSEGRVGLARAVRDMADLYALQHRFTQAEGLYRESLDLSTSVGDRFGIVGALHGIGASLLYLGQDSSAFIYLDQALTTAIEGNYPQEIIGVYHDLAMLEYGKGNHLRSYDLHQRARALQDSLFNFEVTDLIGDLQIRHDLESRDREITLLKEMTDKQNLEMAQIRSQRLILLLAALVLTLIVVVGIYLSFQRSRYTRALAASEKTQHELNTQLTKSLEDQSQLMKIMGHDLRGPMGSIQGLVDLLLISPMDEAKRQKILNSISVSIRSVNILLENLLNWSKLETGRIQAMPERIVIQELLDEIASFVSSSMVEKQINFHVSCDPGEHAWADREMLLTILRNLTSNAIKFTRPGGSVSLRSSSLADGQVIIEVEDTGIGLSPSDLEDLKDPSSFTSRKGTNGETSTGLGLKLVRNLIEINQGSLQIESVPEKGSLFRVALPSSS